MQVALRQRIVPQAKLAGEFAAREEEGPEEPVEAREEGGEVHVNGADVGYRTLPQFRAGDILLMHFRSTFVTELRALADRADEAGLRFALLEDYLVPGTVPGSGG